MKTNLVIGQGQIGTAVQAILKCDGIDKDTSSEEKFDAIHICIPYSKSFIKQVKNYQKKYLNEDGLTIIHSTVAVGTSDELNAVYSPCRGIHPHLEKGIRTFTKCFSGERAEEASKIFRKKGVRTMSTQDNRSLEASKLWDTTQYGFNIILQKEIYRYCKENDLNFDVVYTFANEIYNQGYEELGRPEYKKFILKHIEGKIGGHCVMSNVDLFDSWVCDLIKDKNGNL